MGFEETLNNLEIQLHHVTQHHSAAESEWHRFQISNTSLKQSGVFLGRKGKV